MILTLLLLAAGILSFGFQSRSQTSARKKFWGRLGLWLIVLAFIALLITGIMSV